MATMTDNDLSKLDDDFSIIERLADAIRIEEDLKISPEQRAKIVRDLYEGPRKCLCCINWVEECPHGIDLSEIEKPDDDDSHSHPLIIRRRVIPGEAGTRVDIHSIEIRHAGVRDVLLEVFKGFDGIIADIKYLAFWAPFKQFFYRWEVFEKAIADQKNEEVQNILVTLRMIVKRELAEALAVSKELLGHGVITSRFLWTLFCPGELIYTEEDGQERFYIMQAGRTTPNGGFTMSLNSIEHDGVEFGGEIYDLNIWSFSGTRPITELRAFPAKYLPNFKAVQASLIERGRKWANLAGFHYKAYRASNKHAGKKGKRGRLSPDEQVDRRIIIDGKRHPRKSYINILPDETNPFCSTGLITQSPIQPPPPPGGHRPLPPRMEPGMAPMPGHWENEYDDDVTYAPRRRRRTARVPQPRIASLSPEREVVREVEVRRYPHRRAVSPVRIRTVESSDLSDDEEGMLKLERNRLTDFHLQLCSPRVRGYCLKQKAWRVFDVDRIHDIEWNTKPFESLVLPEGYKDLILAFVESQIKDGDTFDDVINGKGGGLVILLAGDPGVGKTLTAESVAEKIQAPLFKMELGEYKDDRVRRDGDSDSGSDIDENEFVTAFDLAAKWGAVLLIDECDLYLEKRSDTSTRRNRIVSRFLKELEYYPSLLFLTTNRERVLDPAVYSRIHLTINYPALDEPSRLKIWETFLSHKSESSVTEDELDILAKIDVNGRRIRNIVKTARIMAKRENRATGYDDIKKVMRITEGLLIE